MTASVKVLAVLAILAMAAWGGYSYRDASSRAEVAQLLQSIAQERQRAAESIAKMAMDRAVADAKATAARKQLAAERAARAKDNVNATKTLSAADRSSGWTPAEHRLLDDTYCASFPGSAGCVPGAVRDPRQATEAGR